MSNALATSGQDILDIDDLRREELEIPEWNRTVFVRVMTGTERDQFEIEHLKDPSKDIRARLAVYTVCDAENNLLFKRSDVEAVGKKNAQALTRIFVVAARINGITKEDIDELGNA